MPHTPTYSGGYSYRQSPTGPPSNSEPQGHRRYIVAIIVLFIVGLIIGGVVTYAFLIGPDVTDVAGTVTLNSQYVSLYHGVANKILFGSADTGNLSSTVFSDNSYQVYLPTGKSYTVLIQWMNITGSTIATHTCATSPSTFSSSNSNATANFSC